jgi:hypothetical protein
MWHCNRKVTVWRIVVDIEHDKFRGFFKALLAIARDLQKENIYA